MVVMLFSSMSQSVGDGPGIPFQMDQSTYLNWTVYLTQQFETNTKPL